MKDQPTLPFTWQHIFDWYTSRHYQPAEAYTQSDKLWKALAPIILDEMTDAEVEQFAAALSAEHGTYNDGAMELPDITSRDFPACLEKRLKRIAAQKKWASQHQESNNRIVNLPNMVALRVSDWTNTAGKWHWEIIHGGLIDSSGLANTQTEAWAEAEKQWQISQPRLTAERGVLA